MAKEITIKELTEAELIDWFYKASGTKQYVDFYVSELRKQQQPMLEINCGTGEILRRLNAEGVSCDGMDCAAEQIKICGDEISRLEYDSTLYCVDYNNFTLPKLYKTIFIPQSMLCMITDVEMATKFLTNVYNLLENGGTLLFDIYIPWKDITDYHSNKWSSGDAIENPETGEIFVYSYCCDLDLSQQIKTTNSKYELYKDGKLVSVHFDSSQSRWYNDNEMKIILENIGFSSVSFSKILKTSDLDYSTLFTATKLI